MQMGVLSWLKEKFRRKPTSTYAGLEVDLNGGKEEQEAKEKSRAEESEIEDSLLAEPKKRELLRESRERVSVRLSILDLKNMLSIGKNMLSFHRSFGILGRICDSAKKDMCPNLVNYPPEISRSLRGLKECYEKLRPQMARMQEVYNAKPLASKLVGLPEYERMIKDCVEYIAVLRRCYNNIRKYLKDNLNPKEDLSIERIQREVTKKLNEMEHYKDDNEMKARLKRLERDVPPEYHQRAALIAQKIKQLSEFQEDLMRGLESVRPILMQKKKICQGLQARMSLETYTEIAQPGTDGSKKLVAELRAGIAKRDVKAIKAIIVKVHRLPIWDIIRLEIGKLSQLHNAMEQQLRIIGDEISRINPLEDEAVSILENEVQKFRTVNKSLMHRFQKEMRAA